MCSDFDNNIGIDSFRDQEENMKFVCIQIRVRCGMIQTRYDYYR